MTPKFRAWDTKRKKMWSPEEMAKDQLTLMPDGSGFINVSGVSTKLSQPLPHLIPLQFTGLLDKNDEREVYQDSIIRGKNKGVIRHPKYTNVEGRVMWDTESLSWHFKGIFIDTGEKFYTFLSNIIDIEVIGDIHTSPLEGKE